MICEIRQFHLDDVPLLRSLEISVLYVIGGKEKDVGLQLWDVFHVLLGRTFVFCLCTKTVQNL